MDHDNLMIFILSNVYEAPEVNITIFDKPNLIISL